MKVGDLVEGVFVTVMGMGLVFASLGLLMLIIAGLGRIFRERDAAAPVPIAVERPEPEAEVDRHEEIVAAIAVALAVLRQRQQALSPPQTTVITLAPGTSAWRALGRLS